MSDIPILDVQHAPGEKDRPRQSLSGQRGEAANDPARALHDLRRRCYYLRQTHGSSAMVWAKLTVPQ